MNIPALTISILALVFTILTFWWMNWRTGKLIVGSPRSYAAYSSPNGKMAMHLPFVFYNNGPTPIFLQNLRVVFLDEDPPMPLNFIALVDKIGTDEGRTFATQFPINGREAVLYICDFQRNLSGRIFEAGKYSMELQAKLDNNKKWKRISSFDLNVTEKSVPILTKQFIVHDNMSEE